MDGESLNQLAQPPANNTGTTGWIAVRLGVGVQTIRNWQRQGMPTCGVDPRRHGPLFDLDACTRWRQENHPARLHGGVRSGAGKKKSKSPAELVPELSRAETVEERRARGEQVVGEYRERAQAGLAAPEGSVSLREVVVGLTLDEIRAVAFVAPQANHLNLAAMSWYESMLKWRRSELDLAERRSELHDAAECDAARTQHLTLLRTKLLGLAGRAAPVVVADARMGAESVPVVKAALARIVDEIMREIAEDPMGMAA